MTTALTPFQQTWAPRALGALRIVTGYMFIWHGTAKIFGVPHVAMFDGLQLFSLVGLAGVLELVGGALLIVGLFIRPTAFILSGFMAVAYFMGHGLKGNVLLPMLNQDRKSTRLNSSHLVISYAVFCLKKKTPNAYGPP